jgi:hypothetical protein
VLLSVMRQCTISCTISSWPEVGSEIEEEVEQSVLSMSTADGQEHVQG